MAQFLEQRAKAVNGPAYRRTHAIATVALIVAYADRELSEEEIEAVADELIPIAQRHSLAVIMPDPDLAHAIASDVRERIADYGEAEVFEQVRADLDETAARVAITLAAQVAALNGTIGPDQMALLGPIARQLGIDASERDGLIADAMRVVQADLAV
ncbi:hypothetical protein SAMN05421775_113105 [Jannaschia aquimarina]|nr:hypothetical protein SAMN05421775_113105 [Jannaschia aquimarina]